MRLLHLIWLRVRSLVAGRRLDREVDEEIRFHLEGETERHLDRGMTPSDARRAALVDFGGPAQVAESTRESRGWHALETIGGDVRFALRQMRRRPFFAGAALTTLTLGIAATTLVFAVADAGPVRPLPFGDPARLYSLYEVNRRSNIGRTRSAPLNVLDWQAQSQTFSGIAGHIGTGFTLTGGGDAEFMRGQLVTPNLFGILRVQPLLGRTFRDDESEAAHSRVVLLSHQLWMRRFGGDRSVVNTYTTLNGEPYLIAGVMPPQFQYPSKDYQLWVPFITRGTAPGAPPVTRSARYMVVVGRLADGVTESRMRDELAAISGRLSRAYPDENGNVTIGVKSLREDLVGSAKTGLVMLLVTVGIVCLVACVNVAGLTLARGSSRRREIAVRAAIGGSRQRLIRQFLTEGLVLYVAAGAAGIVTARAAIGALRAILPAALPRFNDILVDWRIAAFAAASTLVAGLGFSLLPALGMASASSTSDLTGTTRVVSPGSGSLRARAALIVAQIAAAIVLLGGASLAWRSFERVRHADLGFSPSDAMTFRFVLTNRRYPSADKVRTFVSRTAEALAAVPHVTAVGLTTHLPLADNNFENSFAVDGAPATAGDDPPIAGVRGVAGEYRAAIGARLLKGRDFTRADNETSEPVVIVTQSFAARHIRQRDPVGARMKMGDADSDDPWRKVVGVIADVRHVSVDEPARPEVWFPYVQMPEDVVLRWLRGLGVAARTTGDPETLVPDLRSAMKSLDAEVPLTDIEPLADLANESAAERRLETWMLAGFAATAALLAAIGVFGVLAFYVAQHMQEFGVRLALGATPAQLMQLVLRRGLVLLGGGLALGIPAAWLLGSAMHSLLYETAPYDPIALASAVGALALVTLAACAWPARRAMRTDPLTALRQS